MKKLLKSDICEFREQCTGAMFTQKSQQNQLKKKTENAKRRKRQRRKRNPNRT